MGLFLISQRASVRTFQKAEALCAPTVECIPIDVWMWMLNASFLCANDFYQKEIY
jgi:hypothetical protein